MTAAPAIALLMAVSFSLALAGEALALSEIKREELPAPGAEGVAEPEAEKGGAIPLPVEPGLETGNTEQPDAADEAQPDDPDLPLPEILTDLSLLPRPVQRMRELILEACESGDIEALRRLIGTGVDITQLSLGGIEGDPIDFLREISGDGEGHEILAILQEVLEAGYVHMDAGTPNELYVWPYFFAYPLDKLNARQRVELFRLVTAGDYEDMKAFGGYNFYRAGISPEGQWVFFVAGD